MKKYAVLKNDKIQSLHYSLKAAEKKARKVGGLVLHAAMNGQRYETHGDLHEQVFLLPADSEYHYITESSRKLEKKFEWSMERKSA